MKIIKKMTLVLIAIILTMAMLQVQSNAATGSVSVSVSSSSPNIGDNVTVTLYFSPAIGTGDFTLNYNNSIVEYVSNSVGGTNTGSGVHVIYIDLGGNTISQATFTFKVKAAGTATFSVSVAKLADGQAEKLTPSAGSATITVKTETTSDTTSSTSSSTTSNTTDNTTSSTKSNTSSNTSSTKTNTTKSNTTKTNSNASTNTTTPTPTPEVTESPEATESPDPDEIIEETTIPTEVVTETPKAEELKDQEKNKINLEEVKPQILLYILIIMTALVLIEGIVIIILTAKIIKK